MEMCTTYVLGTLRSKKSEIRGETLPSLIRLGRVFSSNFEIAIVCPVSQRLGHTKLTPVCLLALGSFS